MKSGLVAVLLVLGTAIASAEVVGQIKKVEGEVTLTRGGATKLVQVGVGVHSADVITTGADGSIGITFIDKTMFSAGPSSTISLDRFRFNPSTMKGQLRATLDRGTLKVVSGEMTKGDPEAIKVRTPRAILGVRGTELLIQASVADSGARVAPAGWDDYRPGDESPADSDSRSEP